MAVKDPFDFASDLGRGSYVVNDDEDHAFWVRFVGDNEATGATLTVAANGDLAFKIDAVAESIGTGATIDVSNASFNTFGEIKDAVNTSGTFEVAMGAALRTDSSTDTLLAGTYNLIVGGENIGWTKVLKDTSSAKNIGFCLSMCDNPRGLFDTHHDASTRGVVFSIGGDLDNSTNQRLELYTCLDNKYGSETTETLLYAGSTSSTGTLSTVTWSAGIKPSDRDMGYRIVGRVIDVGGTGTITDGSLTYEASVIDMPKG